MKKSFAVVLILALSLFVFAGCGGDDDETEGEAGSWTGYVVDFAGDTPLPGVDIIVLDNDTGEPISGVEMQTSDANGYVTFTGMPDKELFGFLCKGVQDASVDTYQFNIIANAADEKLWLVDDVTYNTAPLAAGLSLDKTLGVVAGAVYWVNASDEEEIVGCSTVTLDPEAEDIRYFNDNRLPVNIDRRDSVNPLNGYYIAANMEIGKTTATAHLGDSELGSAQFFSVGNAICISNIYAEGDANPMPNDCE